MAFRSLVGGTAVLATLAGLGGSYRLYNKTKHMELLSIQQWDKERKEVIQNGGQYHADEVLLYVSQQAQHSGQDVLLAKMTALMPSHEALELSFHRERREESAKNYSYIRSDGAKVIFENIADSLENFNVQGDAVNHKLGNYYSFSILNKAAPLRWMEAYYIFLTSGLRVSNTFNFFYYTSDYYLKHKDREMFFPSCFGEENHKNENNNDDEHKMTFRQYFEKMESLLNEHNLSQQDHIQFSTFTGIHNALKANRVSFYSSRMQTEIKLHDDEKDEVDFNTRLTSRLTRTVLPAEVGVFLSLPDDADEKNNNNTPRQVNLYAYVVPQKNNNKNENKNIIQKQLELCYLKWYTVNIAKNLANL
ncbi:hypothetical protein ADEAN_000480900 [Angomonas deanei]|uniref:Uncharacterized protein n=1 Tax=Angomonas deanei TaxID=59799 RepID=A0A7G2CEF0_9TRYP|nr:hypothetical protein ADEAN_000480900 [Angomonas deanei]